MTETLSEGHPSGGITEPFVALIHAGVASSLRHRVIAVTAPARRATRVTEEAKSPTKPPAETSGETPTGESRIGLVRRARRINRLLARAYPDAHYELNFSNPLELLVATILS